MTRFAIDAGVALRLAASDRSVAADHRVVAPTLLRSQVLSTLHESVSRGERSAASAGDQLQQVRALPIRLLGDAVMQRRAWTIADQLGWADTYTAEYLAIAQLQAEAFVTLDDDLRSMVADVVETASIDDLFA